VALCCPLSAVSGRVSAEKIKKRGKGKIFVFVGKGTSSFANFGLSVALCGLQMCLSVCWSFY